MILHRRISTVDSWIRNDQEITRAHDAESRVDGVPWPAKAYLTSPVLATPIRRVIISFTARDQGWGNTGHSYVTLQLVRPDGEIRTKLLLTLTHVPTVSQTDITPEDAFIVGAGKGCFIRLVGVSAPYPGYESRLMSAQLEVFHTNPERYEIAVIRRQLDLMNRETAMKLFDPPVRSWWSMIFGTVDEPEEVLRQVDAIKFLLLKCDGLVFSTIVKFLY